ncbi:helix-turn-helix domain-containing protein [Granulicatella seriolae]|uniref:Helix-turn-helix domain-containing protein n=1 Tax=Granulicatella seriolae TaxID=2967226 RepID=A0ABT1WMT5_9LACT|nr:helix-turn-helix transcriptional regulator [Granulicatella seriolae]
MASGYLFKKFRELRGLTQKILGDKVNLSDVRIRQYELDMRNPKDDTLYNIAEALDVKPEYFKDPAYPYDFNEVVRLLFKLEDSIPMAIGKSRMADTEIHTVAFLGHNILKMDQALNAWRQMQNRFMDEEITWEEYEDWKANWPDSMDENYKFNRQNGASTSYKKYIDRAQRQDDKQAFLESMAEKGHDVKGIMAKLESTPDNTKRKKKK